MEDNDEDDDDEVAYGDDEPDIAAKMKVIRGKQRASAKVVESSSSSASEDEDTSLAQRWKQAKRSHNSTGSSQSATANSQGFTQDLSQDLSQTATHPRACSQSLQTIGDYRPVPFRSPAEQAAVAASWAEVAARGNPPPPAMPDYQTDPFSPWAPGGYMNSNTPGNKLPPLLKNFYGQQQQQQQQQKVALPSPTVKNASSRATSPSVRTASPSSSVGEPTPKKKAPAPAKKNKKDTEEEERLQREIETVISAFRPEFRHKIECEDERDLKNMEDTEMHSVARFLNVGFPQPHKLDIAKFNSKQLRKFATNCGVKGGGNLTLFAARKKIALAISMGTVYDDNKIANPKTTSDERKLNTLMRITNACFHNDMKDKFIDLNDTKKRIDYEKAHGGNPVKDFWVAISELTNDSERNDELGVVLQCREGEDERLRGFDQLGHFNLNDFTTQTFVSCQQHMSDCMKARENCLAQMRVSGEHSNDLYTYAINPKWTKFRVSMKPVPAKAVYYCHVVCELYPDIDGKFASFLTEKLKSDSEVDLTGTAGESKGDAKNKAVLSTLVATLSSASSTIAKVLEKKQDERSRADKQHQVKDNKLLWEEYLNLADRFIEMKKDPDKLPLLRNFAKRIVELEKLCGITTEDSVTRGVAGIVPPTIVTVGTTSSTSITSDVTNK
jgi:hypothetical protein